MAARLWQREVYLASVHADDARQLEVLLSQAHALGPVSNMALAHLPALLVLNHAEHPECPVLPCDQTQHMSKHHGLSMKSHEPAPPHGVGP